MGEVFSRMSPCELTATITALANLLAGCMSTDELSLLAAELTQLADTLAVIAAVQASCPVEKTPQIRSLSQRDSPQRHRPSRLLSHAPELLSACLDRSVQPPPAFPHTGSLDAIRES